ncbi:Ig-like protein group 3 [Natranaerovirga hydrolytica]|uniref:Ig-like protein group 3 n=1 Tax=Natranaerovirga hydrolytica TaxID=680378 RepID=A0A4R1MDT4_9FIRM|nr:bacterial Ig-like domain-containing protein [Natranaerovirga hydrolytica]TCK88013.1 Ig-like protein group 3 [Natranaerovirga hydrolytica]
MSKIKRVFGLVMSLVLVFSSFSLTTFAQEEGTFEDMINVSSDWEARVFGDNGGQSNYTSENFDITENEDNTVTMRVSNNRGKIASNSEGIAYYFQELPEDANFELSASVQVDSWEANNQVSFGIMARSNVMEDHINDGSFTGDYVSVGAIDQEMKGFYKSGDSQQKNGYEFEDALLPSPGEEYELSLQKSGDIFSLTVNGETKILDEFDKALNYVGLYVSRNTAVTFSNVRLNIEGQVELGDYENSFFGDIGGQSNVTEEKYEITELDENALRMRVSENSGKIASSSEGIAYYFKEVPPSANYEITTNVKVEDWTANNQVGFGIMLRGDVLYDISDGSHTSDYIAVGAIDQEMKGFFKQGDSQQKNGYEFENALLPAPGEEYELSLQKSGDVYILEVDGETQIVQEFDGMMNFAGFFVSRNATVEFTDFDIQVDNRVVEDIIVDTSNMDTEFLLEQELDLTGINVTAIYTDGSQSQLSESDFIVTGYDSSEVGTTTVTLNHNGQLAEVDFEIIPLTATALNVIYYPAKTDYYMGDTFDPEGFVVEAVYNDGYKVEEITEENYNIAVEGEVAEEGYVFESAGEKEVTVISTETPETTTTITVNVSDAELTNLEVTSMPEKTLYFLDDALELEGLVVYATYDDGNEVRLMRDEFEVSDLNTATAGNKTLTVSHKDLTTTFNLEVKARELVGIEVTEYPQTTYTIGEDFDSTGMEISAVYDNLDKELLDADEFTVDTDAFDNSSAGVYEIVISSSVGNVVLPVTVREETAIEWNSIIFGQSISEDKNEVNIKEDGTIELFAEGNAGKITGDHDGISYYYTVVDANEDNFTVSADVKVIEYAKDPHDGQESFGIMARDAIGTHLDSSVFAGNLAAVGGFSGGTRDPNGTQLFIRKGVIATDGSDFLEDSGRFSKMIEEVRPATENTYPEQDYRLTLSKTNSGFVGQLNNGEEVMFFEPDILTLQDEDQIYVGFYAAREAHIEVSNIEMDITAAATDAPRVYPPAEAIEPEFEIVSLERTSETDFDFMLESNVDGIAIIKQGHDVIGQDLEVTANEKFVLPTEIDAMDKTNFSVTFLPDDTQFLTDYDKMVQNFTVEHRTYVEDGDIYVSPEGTIDGEGTRENPLDLDTAIDFVRPGQRIMLMDGHYMRETRFEIKKYNDGTPTQMKYLFAEPGTNPVIDADRRVEGGLLSGDYWYIRGVDFARSSGNSHGFRIGGNHNIIENSRFYENGDTGLQISRTDDAPNIEDWPSYNLILNSVAFDNRDPSGNNADGFAAKLTSGYGNVFKGCIAHNNIDDGWDLYTKVGDGEIGPVTIIDSIAYNNGVLTDGTIGNGKNGFKLGGEGVNVPHVLKNSVAFGQAENGITSNSNPGLIVEDSLSFNNGRNVYLYTYTNIETDFQVDGLVSVQDDPENASADSYPENIEADNNYLFDGEKSVNASGEELAITQEDIDKLNNLAELIRDERGNINWDDFYEIVGPFIQ